MDPVHEAAANGALDAVKTILQSKPVLVNARHRYHGSTPLMYASEKGHLHVAQYLLDNGARVDQMNTQRDTALTKACRMGRDVGVVSLLLRRGADVVHKDVYGRSALYLATDYRHTDAMKVLLAQRGSKIDDADVDGETPLYRACLRGYEEVVRLLLEAGADPSCADACGLTPRRVAETEDKAGCVSILAAWERGLTLYVARKLFDDEHERALQRQTSEAADTHDMSLACIDDRVAPAARVSLLPSSAVSADVTMVEVVRCVLTVLSDELFREVVLVMDVR